MSESDIFQVQLWFAVAAIAFLAVAMTAAGWNHRIFVWSMFVVAAALAVIAASWRNLRLYIPDQADVFFASIGNNPVVWLGTFIIAMIAVFVIAKLRGMGADQPKPIPTSLRLQFQPNSVNPTCLNLQNVWSWYALRHTFTVMEGPSPANPQGRQYSAHQWSLYITFERPAAIKQIVFNGNGAVLPTIESKDRGPRHAIIIISGDLGSTMLDITGVV